MYVLKATLVHESNECLRKFEDVPVYSVPVLSESKWTSKRTH